MDIVRYGFSVSKVILLAETSFQLYSSFHDNANMCMKLDGCFGRLNTLYVQ